MATKRPRFRFKPNKRSDAECPTNGTLAEWADAGIRGFLDATGEPNCYEDSIRDLMADLLHLCDREGVAATAAIDWAMRRWEEER